LICKVNKPLIKLKLKRIEKELTQEEMALKLKLSPSTYKSYEQGSREPNISTLKKITKILKCKVDEII